MQTNLETLSSLERRITMAVPADDINKEVEQRLKQLSRTVRMSGFRPGKVPLKIVEQQYGPQVRSEVLGDAVQKTFQEVVAAQNLRIAGNPRIEPKTDGIEAGSLAFSATFEMYPEVKVGDLAAAKVERPVFEVTDAEVEKTVDILRKQRATFHEVSRASQAGDRVSVDFIGRIDGVEFAGGKGEGVPVVLGEGRMLPDFETGLTGMSAGETRDFRRDLPGNLRRQGSRGQDCEFRVHREVGGRAPAARSWMPSSPRPWVLPMATPPRCVPDIRGQRRAGSEEARRGRHQAACHAGIARREFAAGTAQGAGG
jgi:trigger factor